MVQVSTIHKKATALGPCEVDPSSSSPPHTLSVYSSMYGSVSMALAERAEPCTLPSLNTRTRRISEATEARALASWTCLAGCFGRE